MIGEEDWNEPRLFLAEQTQTIRAGLATLMVPLLLIAAAGCFLCLTSKARPQLAAAQTLHAPSVMIDRH